MAEKTTWFGTAQLHHTEIIKGKILLRPFVFSLLKKGLFVAPGFQKRRPLFLAKSRRREEVGDGGAGDARR